ncbi:MAG: hypothetical protein IKS03_07850 [Ruminococcus sp.]|nr:hypothetical protein [Ruminococcus sp.]
MEKLKAFLAGLLGELWQEIISCLIVVGINLTFSFAENKMGEKVFSMTVFTLLMSIFPIYEIYAAVSLVKTRKKFLGNGGKSGKIISCGKREKDFIESEKNKKYIVTARTKDENYEIPSDKKYKKGSEILFEVNGYDFPKISDLKCFQDSIAGTFIFGILFEFAVLLIVYIFVQFGVFS